LGSQPDEDPWLDSSAAAGYLGRRLRGTHRRTSFAAHPRGHRGAVLPTVPLGVPQRRGARERRSAPRVGSPAPLGVAHRTARLPHLGRSLVERHGGHVPRGRQELLALPGVGEYVANAVRAVAFGEREPLLDPNIIRLIGRVFGLRSQRARPRDDPALWAFIR